MNLMTTMTRLARRVGGIIAECNYAQRRLITLRIAPDSYLTDPDRAPDSYPEFLFRASGVLLHEPAARARGTFAS
ncbi:MAG: hypothetical protein JO132_06360 [Streptosporangiaceae bacterium]|nr:hypothetical protein [Streptosporangiaceae bacterium]